MPDHPVTPAAPDRASASSAHGWARAAHRVRAFLLLAAVVAILDQATKAVVRANLAVGERWPDGWELIRLTHIRNTGAAFGILQGAGDFLVVASLLGVGAITFFLLSLPGHGRLYPLTLSLILGGAIGNLIDRVRLGHVTDFIDPWNYPAFNLADSAIVIGVIGMAILSFMEPDEAPASPARTGGETSAEHAG